MRVVKSVIRGTPVKFTAGFLDTAGVVVIPASATLKIVYLANGVIASNTISMELDVNEYFTWWDSSVADPCIADWTIKPSSNTEATVDGKLTVMANRANLLA